MLKLAGDEIVKDLLVIFRSCIIKGYIPEACKQSEGKILPKPGKTEYTKAKAYRIIILSSCMLTSSNVTRIRPAILPGVPRVSIKLLCYYY